MPQRHNDATKTMVVSHRTRAPRDALGRVRPSTGHGDVRSRKYSTPRSMSPPKTALLRLLTAWSDRATTSGLVEGDRRDCCVHLQDPWLFLHVKAYPEKPPRPTETRAQQHVLHEFSSEHVLYHVLWCQSHPELYEPHLRRARRSSPFHIRQIPGDSYQLYVHDALDRDMVREVWWQRMVTPPTAVFEGTMLLSKVASLLPLIFGRIVYVAFLDVPLWFFRDPEDVYIPIVQHLREFMDDLDESQEFCPEGSSPQLLSVDDVLYSAFVQSSLHKMQSSCPDFVHTTFNEKLLALLHTLFPALSEFTVDVDGKRVPLDPLSDKVLRPVDVYNRIHRYYQRERRGRRKLFLHRGDDRNRSRAGHGATQPRRARK